MSGINANCAFHPNRIAYSICNNCQKPLCNECVYDYATVHPIGVFISSNVLIFNRNSSSDLCYSCYSEKLKNGVNVITTLLVIANLVAILFFFPNFGILPIIIVNIVFIPLFLYSRIKLSNLSKERINLD